MLVLCVLPEMFSLIPPAILIDEPCTCTHINTHIFLQTMYTGMLMHMILSYICMHTLLQTPTLNTHTHTHTQSRPSPWKRDTSTLQLDTAWDEHITLWQIDGAGERQVGWKEGEGRVGRRLAFSSALEEFVLAAKLFLFFFIPFLLMKPTLCPHLYLPLSHS